MQPEDMQRSVMPRNPNYRETHHGPNLLITKIYYMYCTMILIAACMVSTLLHQLFGNFLRLVHCSYIISASNLLAVQDSCADLATHLQDIIMIIIIIIMFVKNFNEPAYTPIL